ncbi:hypothetical protein ccbrp13_40400 [Ktedonobacteria bacterium brp13]|nr:hypothetical protein ccbrp13_40400 [Ktedonobacteria bacterium brp13]
MQQQSQNNQRRRRSRKSPDDIVRIMLASCATVTVLAILLVFAHTGNNAILLATGPLGMAVAPAFRYYFPDKQQP